MTETPTVEPEAPAAEATAPPAAPVTETKSVPFWKKLLGKS